MFMGIYRFSGNTDSLRAAYDRLIGMIPHTGLHLHVCVSVKDGLTIYDSCPTREIFMSFAQNADFRGALKAAGLPEPEVTPMGDIHAAFVAGKRTI